MTRFVIERCLSMVSILGLGFGVKKKNVYWLLAAVVSASIRVGMAIQRLAYDLDEEE